MKRAQPESRIQRAIRDRLAAHGFQSVHVPNGSKLAGTEAQRARAGARLKAEGMMPGFPDLLVYGRGGRIAHIEVKAEGGRQQPTQRACEQWLSEWGHLYAVCRSQDDATEALRQWGWL